MVFFLTAMFEYISMKINRKNNVTLSFFYNRGENNRVLTTIQGRKQFYTLDPNLGYSHSIDSPDNFVIESKHFFLPGFVVYSDAKELSNEDYIIVVLGGSTTDPLIRPHSWPDELSKILQTNGIDAVVVNGGVGAYSSSQEVFKLIRDVVELEPNLILTYDGINDLNNWAPLPNPMVHPFQRRILKHIIDNQTGKSSQLLPNILFLVQRLRQKGNIVKHLTVGINTQKDSGEFLVRNIDIMHSVATGLGIEHVGFLQPVLGVGAYRGDKKIWDYVINKKGGTYLKRLKNVYATAKKATATRDYYVDLSDLFIGQDTIYTGDGRHLTLKGNKIVAQTIFDKLEKHALLPNK
jgi:lysophospholipase L1-like esterase